MFRNQRNRTIAILLIISLLLILAVFPSAVSAQGRLGGLVSVTFRCPDTVDYSFLTGFQISGDYSVVITTGGSSVTISYPGLPGNTLISDSFTLSTVGGPITVELYVDFDGIRLVDSVTITPRCVGCTVQYPILSSAIMTTAQTTRAYARSGDAANDQFNNPIFLPTDADGGGQDEYLVVDTLIADFNNDGVMEFWVGLFIGTNCEPVFVPIENVTLTRPLPAYDAFLASQGDSQG